ncbi:MAG: CBS domain-containing protein [Gammaproteobacteria bacterium]|nr:CBS domain-containing protein [Gammaproteobacteria bacterium]
MKIKDVMVTNVKACGPDDKLESVAMVMWNNDCGSVPVVDIAGKAIGIVTDRDISMAAALNHKALWDMTPREIMNGRALHTCRTEDDIKSALKIMWAQKVRRLPVVDDIGQLQGILSVDDLVACAERGTRGLRAPDLSYDDTITTLKAVCRHH